MIFISDQIGGSFEDSETESSIEESEELEEDTAGKSPSALGVAGAVLKAVVKEGTTRLGEQVEKDFKEEYGLPVEPKKIKKREMLVRILKNPEDKEPGIEELNSLQPVIPALLQSVSTPQLEQQTDQQAEQPASPSPAPASTPSE